MLPTFSAMRRLSFIVFVLTAGTLIGQTYPKDYFRSPMDITIKLAGNFGELRPNHFHAGIDITTAGVENLAVRAAADGYVSRIKISPWGYGKAIYITHPNGYTTVYGHLNSFNTAIGDWAESQQYIAESFEVDIYPKPNELTVKKGDQIGYSGNTGSSGGPHLHFEIRDSKTEEALNPLLFGLPVSDNVPPVPVMLAVYAVGDGAYVNGTKGMKKIPLVKSGNKFVFQNAADSVLVYGDIGFGIDTYDKETLAHGKNGVYGIKLRSAGKTIYSHRLERIPFEDSRYINCFVDYEEHERTGKYFQLSYLLPNNELPVYDSVVNRGLVSHTDGKYHWYTYEITDVYGNKSLVEFKVKALPKNPENKDVNNVTVPFAQVLVWNQENRIEEDQFTFSTPAKSVYKNVQFRWTSTKATGSRLTPTIGINDRYTSLHKVCTLSIKMAANTEMTDKLVLCREKDKGGIAAIGGTWNGNGMTAEIKDFGKYFVMRDTTAPTLKPMNFDKGKVADTVFTSMKTIQFKVGDNLSGVKKYRGTLDGKWVLFEYEPKKDRLQYTFDEHCGKGKHELVMVVTDAVGNKTSFTRTFIR